MKIILDDREHYLYEKCKLFIDENSEKYSKLHLEKKTLQIGDIILETDNEETICIIERKTFSDLISSIKDGRYEEQSHRLKHTSGIHSHNIIYLLEGMFSQLRTSAEKQVIYSAMASIHFYKGFSAIRCSNTQESAELIVHYADKLHRNNEKNNKICYPIQSNAFIENNESDETKNNHSTPSIYENESYSNFVKKTKKENITLENIGEIMLCQIPDVSSQSATSIMKEYKSIGNLINCLEANSQCIDSFCCIDKNGKSRKIKKNSIENIKNFLLIDKIGI